MGNCDYSVLYHIYGDSPYTKIFVVWVQIYVKWVELSPNHYFKQ